MFDAALNSRLLGMLACPHCRLPLQQEASKLRCASCSREYELREGVPQLLPAPLGQLPTAPGKIAVQESGWVGTAKRLVNVPSPTLETPQLRRRIPDFIAGFPAEARIANIGSAGLRHGEKIINLDLLHGEGVDVVGDATALPFQDNVLDGIICRRVLEHVCKPGKAVAEFHRVLKPGGRVWVEIPFMQGYHPAPTDYQRYTRAGIEDLFDQFRVLDVGVALGPSSTLSWIVREYLAILFSFNRPVLYKIGERLFSWLTLPVKLLDYGLAQSRFAGQIASSFYLVAEKPEQSTT